MSSKLLKLVENITNYQKTATPEQRQAISDIQDRLDRLVSHFEKKMVWMINEMNNLSKHASQNLLAIAAFLATFASAFLSDPARIIYYSQQQKVIIFLALASIVISVAFGALNYIFEKQFYQAWASHYQKSVNTINALEFETFEAVQNKIFTAETKLDKQSKQIFFRIQISLVSFSFLLLLYFVYISLFGLEVRLQEVGK